MDEKERITTNHAKKKKLTFLLFTPESPCGRKPGRWEKCHAELCSRKLSVKLYGEHPSVKYLSWRMFGGYGIRKGGGRVRDVVPHIIHVWLIFKGPNYKRPCIKVRHCKSHGQHQYLKVFPDQEPWAELCCSQPGISRTAIGFFPSTNPCHLVYPVHLLADLSCFPLGSRLVCSHEFSHHYEPSWRFFGSFLSCGKQSDVITLCEYVWDYSNICWNYWLVSTA